MGKTKKSSFILILVVSVILNIFFLINIYYFGNKQQLSWSRRAAEEAEAVAAISCSGHGRAYLDGPVDADGKPLCECNTCFNGSDCSIFTNECTADARSADATFLEPFWIKKAASSALLVSGWHRMSYNFSDQTYISKELENHIRKLHALVGNAVTDGKHIMFGVGAIQLLNAAVYALSNHNSSWPAKVVASIPYYPPFRTQTEYFNSVDFTFKGDASTITDKTNVIEFVTSPNNPDGLFKKAVVPGSSAIYDNVYYWPHYSAIPAPFDEDLMIFALSKFTGHAGSRFGWAIIKDKAVYNRMLEYSSTSVIGVSRDTQLKSLQLIKVIIEGNGKEIFEFGYEAMRQRWEKLSQVLSKSKRFSVEQIPPQYCTFFQRVREATPGFAWIKCELEEDKNCNAVLLEEANIGGNAGSAYSVDDRYVRLSLVKRQDDFDILLKRISELVSQEEGGAKII